MSWFRSEAEPIFLKITGQRSGMSWSPRKLSRVKSLRVPDRPCKTGRFSQWRKDHCEKTSATESPSSRTN